MKRASRIIKADSLAGAGARAAAVLAAAFIFIFCLLIPIRGDALAEVGGIIVTTNKLVYQPGDTVAFDIVVDSGGRDLTGDLEIRVFPAASSLSQNAFSQTPLSETQVASGFRVNGTADAQFESDIGDLKAGTGGFPVRVSLTVDGSEVLSGTTWLAVVEPGAHPPLDLVLLWTVGGVPGRNSQGVFESTHLLERCQLEPRSPDSLLQHPELARKFPRIKTTYAIEGSMLDELLDLQDGYTVAAEGREKEVDPDSAEALAAASCIEGLRYLTQTGNAEILSAPYVFSSLPVLAREGWDDGNGQFRVGRDALAEALALAAFPRGAYIPGLELTTDSLRYVAATGGEYAVLAGFIRNNVTGRVEPGELTFRLRDLSGERITGLFAEDDASAALLGEEPDVNAFFAALANAYGSGGPRLFIAASGVANPAITAGQRERVYSELDSLGWIQSMTLAEAKAKYSPETEPVTLQRYIDPLQGFVSRSYYEKLSSVHHLFEAYREAVDTDEPERLREAKNMYLAESSYFLRDDATPEEANRGLAYLDQVAGFVQGEMSGLSLEVDTPFLQGSSDGEAVITVINENLYPFTLDLAVWGEGLSFEGEGAGAPEQELRLQTGHTEVRIPYSADGWSRLEVRLNSRGFTLVEDSDGVRLMTRPVWIVIMVSLAAVLAGAGYYVAVVRRR